MKVLAIGGAGHVGSQVVKELLKRKAEVDVVVRKEGTKVSEGATAVVGDLLDPVFLEKALDGIDKLYLLNAAFQPSFRSSSGLPPSRPRLRR